MFHIFPISAPALFARSERAFSQSMAVFIGIRIKLTVLFTRPSIVLRIAEPAPTKSETILSVVVVVSSVIHDTALFHPSAIVWKVPCNSPTRDMKRVEIKAPRYSQSETCWLTLSLVDPVSVSIISVKYDFTWSIRVSSASIAVLIASATYIIVGDITSKARVTQFTRIFIVSNTINAPDR